MARKAFVLTAFLIVVVIIVSIIISIVAIVNTKPVVFRPLVTYEEGTTKIVEVSDNRSSRSDDDDDLSLISKLFKHEKTIMVGSLFVVIIFALLFYGAKRSKS